MSGARVKFSRSAIAADAVAVAYFVVGNVFLILGESGVSLPLGGGRYPGVEFIYHYYSAPIYQLLLKVYAFVGGDTLSVYLVAELVLLLSAVILGLLVYTVFKGISLVRV